MSVGQKFKNETRHETAIRYIQQAEKHTEHLTGKQNEDKQKT
jgi:hypothetical protein